jgi:diadenosine tetraphosphate (Ap4A) HIT family hydrolase
MVNRFWDKEGKYKEGFLKEYSHWVLEVSYRQHTLGSFIIFCKRQGVERISQLTDEEVKELRNVMKEIEETLSKIDGFKPDRFNYLQLGNQLHNLHFHGIPRYKEKRVFDGKEWVDETWGHPPKWSKKEVNKDLVIKIRGVIKENLPS